MIDVIREMNTLIYQLNEYTKAYDEGKPLISDEEWDNLYFKLKQMEGESGIILGNSPTQSIPFEVKTSLKKVTHNHPMLSLDKTKSIPDIEAFMNKNPTIAMCKMDGLTCSLRYIDGKLFRAETRGNGEIGEDITHNALHIKSIPKQIGIKDDFVIDGEIICTADDFEPFAEDYKNPRNFAAGSIRLLDSKESASRCLTFVAWDCISEMEGCKTLSQKLQGLKTMGFTVVPWTSGDAGECIDEMTQCAEELGYPIDGIVFKYNNCEYYNSLGQTGHHARGGLAYKFYDDVYTTSFIGFDFNVSRNGTLTPVAVFRPVDIDDTMVERASLHNVNTLKQLCAEPLHVGDTLGVIKSNMIIPQVVSWTPDGTGEEVQLPTKCPVCGKKLSYKKSDGGTESIECENPNCSCRILNRLDHYTGDDGMKVKYLGRANLEILLDYEWIDSISDIYKVYEHRAEWIKLPGYGASSVDRILKGIEDSKNCTLAQFISALGIPGISNVYAKSIADYYCNWPNFIKAMENKEPIPVFRMGEVRKAALRNFDYTEAKKIAPLLNFIDARPSEQELQIPQTLKGEVVCVTGTLVRYKNRNLLYQEINDHGGVTSNSVTRKTTILINNDIHSLSNKNRDARERGIPILTEYEFVQKYLV